LCGSGASASELKVSIKFICERTKYWAHQLAVDEIMIFSGSIKGHSMPMRRAHKVEIIGQWS